MVDTTYNGWTNRETWLVNLWIDNDALLEDFECESNDAYQAGQMIMEHIEAGMDDITMPGLFKDLLGTAYRAANWEEIGSHYIQNRDEGRATA